MYRFVFESVYLEIVCNIVVLFTLSFSLFTNEGYLCYPHYKLKLCSIPSVTSSISGYRSYKNPMTVTV